MASTIYRRPDLFPFSFASIYDLGGLGSTYRAFGNTSDALNCLTNLSTFQIAITWSLSWRMSYFAPGFTYAESCSVFLNLPLFSPSMAGAINNTAVGWYNNSTAGAKYVNPAARVLFSGSGGNSLVNASSDTESETSKISSCSADLLLSRNGGVVLPALRMQSIHDSVNDVVRFSTHFDERPGETINTISLSLFGTTFPYYLSCIDPSPAEGFTTVGPVTFNATVTPTFASS